MAFLFPVSLRGTHFAAGPRSLASSGSSSRELLLLFRVRTAPNLPRTHVRGRLPWGSTPHRDISTESPLASEHPKLTLRSVLGVSHALDGLLLSLPCGFISPRSHVRDSRLRGFFPLPGRSASSAYRTLLSFAAFSYRRVASTAPDPAGRLQGLHPGSDPRSPTGCLGLPPPRSPLTFQLPRASLRTPWERLRAPSALHLDRQTLRVNLAAGLQRIVGVRPGTLSPDYLPVRALWF